MVGVSGVDVTQAQACAFFVKTGEVNTGVLLAEVDLAGVARLVLGQAFVGRRDGAFALEADLTTATVVWDAASTVFIDAAITVVIDVVVADLGDGLARAALIPLSLAADFATCAAGRVAASCECFVYAAVAIVVEAITDLAGARENIRVAVIAVLR